MDTRAVARRGSVPVTGLQSQTTSRLLAVAGIALGAGMVARSPLLVITAGVLAWLVLVAALPKGGATPAIAIGILWSNAAVVGSEQFGVPAALGLLPQLLLGAVVIGRVVVHQRPLLATPRFKALLIHGAAIMVAALAALDARPVQSVVITFAVEGVLLWFVVINAIEDRQALERVLLALMLAGAFLGSISIIQFVTGTYGNDYFGFAQVGASRLDLLESGASTLPRLAGSIGEQNRYAQSLLVLIPLGIALARRGSRLGFFSLALIVPVAAGVALTGSRGALVGFVVTFAVMAGMRLVSIRTVGVLALSAAALVLVIPGYGDRILNTIQSADAAGGTEEVDTSTLSRVTTNLAALHMFEDHLWLGVGPDGFPELYESYAERVGLNVKDESRQPHNLYLGIGAELGLLGLVTFMAMPLMLLVSLIRSWRALRLHDPPIADLAAGLVGAIVAYLSTGVFLHLAFDRYYWGLLAVCDVGARIVRSSEATHLRTDSSHDMLATSAA